MRMRIRPVVEAVRATLRSGLILAAGAAAVSLRAQAQPPRGQPAGVEPPPVTMERFMAPGSEAARLARQVGRWEVVMTIRPAPDAAPVVAKGLVAERAMIGLYFQEIMKPAPGSGLPDFQRIDYLTYDAVQARWEYVSIDTRAPIGIMFARGFGSDIGPEITVYFDNFANPGLAPGVGGSVRARHVDKANGDDRHLKQQFWTRPGAPEWLAVQYEYTRRR
jgi:hypothetical protein